MTPARGRTAERLRWLRGPRRLRPLRWLRRLLPAGLFTGGGARAFAGARTTVGTLVVVASVLAGPGCSTVALGDPPADVNVCHPSQTFFRDMIWPNFLSKTYANNRTCGDSDCHGNSARRLRVVAPTSTPTPTVPFVAGSDWDELYNSTTQVLVCTNVLGSELFTRPAGLQTHGGGTLIDPSPAGPEALLLEAWVKAAP